MLAGARQVPASAEVKGEEGAGERARKAWLANSVGRWSCSGRPQQQWEPHRPVARQHHRYSHLGCIGSILETVCCLSKASPGSCDA